MTSVTVIHSTVTPWRAGAGEDGPKDGPYGEVGDGANDIPFVLNAFDFNPPPGIDPTLHAGGSEAGDAIIPAYTYYPTPQDAIELAALIAQYIADKPWYSRNATADASAWTGAASLKRNLSSIKIALQFDNTGYMSYQS